MTPFINHPLHSLILSTHTHAGDLVLQLHTPSTLKLVLQKIIRIQ
jgi:hypothetical protein